MPATPKKRRAVRSRSPEPRKRSNLMLRLDEAGKSAIVRAAELRSVSVSDYVRELVVTQARRELAQATRSIIGLSADEQLAFWTALQAKPRLTRPQRRLARLMRGDE